MLAQAFKGDYRTPTCTACGVKLVEREGKGGPFWGCRKYPRCKVTLPRAA
ncbi:topoisomerase DNA-binding C4 zinc finger domain-containing protein [Cupriavidus taiwanensis]